VHTQIVDPDNMLNQMQLALQILLIVLYVLWIVRFLIELTVLFVPFYVFGELIWLGLTGIFLTMSQT
jgi:hypothetical protein